jgi:hypothetical protein
LALFAEILSQYYGLHGDKPLVKLNIYFSFESFHAFTPNPKYIVDTTVYEIARFYVTIQNKVFRRHQYIVP